MEIKFRQKQIGWCAVLTIANVFNDEGFLKYLEDPKYKGCSTEDINFMMSEHKDSQGMKLTNVLYAQQSYSPLPVDYIWDMVKRTEQGIEGIDEVVIPYILTVKRIEQYFHSTAILNHNGEVYYLDPWNEKFIKIKDQHHLSEMFIGCWTVERPYRTSDDRFISLNGQYFEYPFLNNG